MCGEAWGVCGVVSVMGTILEVGGGMGGLRTRDAPGCPGGGMGGVRAAWHTESWTLRVIETHPGARVPGAWVVWVVPGAWYGWCPGAGMSVPEAAEKARSPCSPKFRT